MTLPLPKTDQLLDRLRVLLDTDSHDELELHRLRQELKRQIALYPGDGDACMAMAIMERQAGHEEEAIRQHEAALQCGWTPDRALNYAVTLSAFYRNDEALRQAQNVLNQDPLNLDALRAALNLASTTGRFRLQRNLLAEYAKRIPDRLPNNLAEMEAAVDLIVATVEELRLSDDDLAALHRPLWELLRTTGWGQEIHINDQVCHDGGDRFLSRTLRLPLSFESAQALNWRWVERLAEQDESWPMEKMMITLREAA